MRHKNPKNAGFNNYKTANFNARVEEGIRRAPEERAIAVREFWNWLTRSA